MANAKPSIFISHISEEAELALILKENLLADFNHQVDIFVSSDLEQIAAGDDWLTSIRDALEVAGLDLILCSRLSITRAWVNFEVGAAWLKKIPIVPICHSGLQVGDLPVPYSVFNGLDAGDDRGLKKLYRGIARNLGIDCERDDFEPLAAAVQKFESSYAVSVRMRGQASALVDARQGERLVGTWEGTGRDLEVPDEIQYKTKLTYELKLELRRRQNVVSGELHVHSLERDLRMTAFIEMINAAEYFYFKYWVAVPNANHCGFMVMHLSSLGDQLEGMFLTNKILEHQIGLGKVVFKRAVN
jgi:hypothetical protein